jgi:hypothetical protein
VTNKEGASNKMDAPSLFPDRASLQNETRDGSAHELLWNFLPAIQPRRNLRRAQTASSIYKGASE